MQFLIQFVAAFALAILVWSVGNSEGVDDAALAARKFGIIAVPSALAIAGLSYLAEKFLGSFGLFLLLFVAYLAYCILAKRKGIFSEPGSIIPFALIFPVVWSLLSWSVGS